MERVAFVSLIEVPSPLRINKTHRSLNKDAPSHRAVQRLGVIASRLFSAGFITNIAESSFRYTHRPRLAALIVFLLSPVSSLFKSKSQLEAENAALRQQLIVLQRKVRSRVQVTNSDRLFFIQLYWWFPSVLKATTIIRPETLVRWHRAGFRRYWRWKSRNLGGRQQISADLRALIRRMSVRPWRQTAAR